MDREAARRALIKIADQNTPTWQRARREAFLGDTTIETGNTLYRFSHGVFSGRASRPHPGCLPAWESPPSMKGVELVGFLTAERGLWSFSTQWRRGALAVITLDEGAFTLTSPTLACTIERPRTPARRPPATSHPVACPPTVRRPAPPSMTRLQLAPMR